eukprot:jgi/Orpsp1_1/1191237/evm.model.d7180000084313.1
MNQRVLNVLLTAITVAASYIPSDTAGENDINSHRILNPFNYNIKPHTKLNSDFPSSFDLRDVDGMNFISPVKNQGGWSTCWVFAGMAASEASAQYELYDEFGITPDELSLDFSELQIA